MTEGAPASNRWSLRGRGPRIVAATLAASLLVLGLRVAFVLRSSLATELALDDAYISFRYARNLATGQGLVFNPGERVEGYTNFLWTLLLSGALAAGASPVPAAVALAASAAIGTLLLLALLSHRLLSGPLATGAAVLPPLLFAALESQSRHLFLGMETHLFVFLVFASFSVLLYRWCRARGAVRAGGGAGAAIGRRTASASGALFALASMTRPEGLMFTAIGGLMVLVETGGGWRSRLRFAGLFAGSFLALYGPYTAWRVSYYGHPLPNTFYAKVAGPPAQVVARGWESLVSLMAQWPVWPLLVLAVFALKPVVTAGGRVWAWLFGVALVTWVSFVLLGGDFLVFFGPRMLMPVLPFVLLLAAEGLRRLVRPAGEGAIGKGVLAAAVVGLLLHALSDPWPHELVHLGGLAATNRGFHEAAEWLTQEGPAEASVATAGVGIVPYVTGWTTFDMYGLVDEHVAHEGQFDPHKPPGHAKSDPVYILDREPDFLISNLNPAGVPRAARLGWVADRVRREYELVAQFKTGRGPLVRGRRVVEVEEFQPRLYRRGYRRGILRRVDPGP